MHYFITYLFWGRNGKRNAGSIKINRNASLSSLSLRTRSLMTPLEEREGAGKRSMWFLELVRPPLLLTTVAVEEGGGEEDLVERGRLQ